MVAVTTGVSRLVVIEPILEVQTPLRVANGIAQALPNQPFWIFVSNVSKEPRCSPKKMVVETASRSTLEIREVPENIGHEFTRCLDNFADKVEAEGDTQGDETE